MIYIFGADLLSLVFQQLSVQYGLALFAHIGAVLNKAVYSMLAV